MRGQGKNVLKCVPTHQKWPNYQEFLAHLAGYFCTCEYTMLFWDKMVHLSGMFIYPAVHLCVVHCIYIYIYIYIQVTEKPFTSK